MRYIQLFDNTYLLIPPTRLFHPHADRKLPEDQLCQLAFALGHCYPNWTDSIKLPMPTQLAHKLGTPPLPLLLLCLTSPSLLDGRVPDSLP